MEAQRTTVTKYRFAKNGDGFIPTGMTVTVQDSVTIPDEKESMKEVVALKRL